MVVIQAEDLEKAINQLLPGTSQANSVALIASFDLDNNRSITVKEFTSILENKQQLGNEEGDILGCPSSSNKSNHNSRHSRSESVLSDTVSTVLGSEFDQLSVSSDCNVSVAEDIYQLKFGGTLCV